MAVLEFVGEMFACLFDFVAGFFHGFFQLFLLFAVAGLVLLMLVGCNPHVAGPTNSAAPIDMTIKGNHLSSSREFCKFTGDEYELTINDVNTPNPYIATAGMECTPWQVWEDGTYAMECENYQESDYFGWYNRYYVNFYKGPSEMVGLFVWILEGVPENSWTCSYDFSITEVDFGA